MGMFASEIHSIYTHAGTQLTTRLHCNAVFKLKDNENNEAGSKTICEEFLLIMNTQQSLHFRVKSHRSVSGFEGWIVLLQLSHSDVTAQSITSKAHAWPCSITFH